MRLRMWGTGIRGHLRASEGIGGRQRASEGVGAGGKAGGTLALRILETHVMTGSRSQRGVSEAIE